MKACVFLEDQVRDYERAVLNYLKVVQHEGVESDKKEDAKEKMQKLLCGDVRIPWNSEYHSHFLSKHPSSKKELDEKIILLLLISKNRNKANNSNSKVLVKGLSLVFHFLE